MECTGNLAVNLLCWYYSYSGLGPEGCDENNNNQILLFLGQLKLLLTSRYENDKTGLEASARIS